MWSIAALVGLVTLFGIAARNGILLVARYRDLTTTECDFDDVVREGTLSLVRQVSGFVKDMAKVLKRIGHIRLRRESVSTASESICPFC